MKFTFKIREKIKEAWGMYKENWGSFVGVSFILIFLQTISNKSSGYGSYILYLLIFIVSSFLSYILYRFIFNLLDKKNTKLFSREFFPSNRAFWDYLKTNLLVTLCIIPLFIIPFFAMIGLFVSLFLVVALGKTLGISLLFVMLFVIFLLSIPAIYVSIRLFPAKYLSIEKCQGARKSIKEAWMMTRGYGWNILRVGIVLFFFIMLGVLAFVIGIFVTLPIALIVITMFYRDLAKFRIEHSQIVETMKNDVAQTVPPVEVKTEEKADIVQ